MNDKDWKVRKDILEGLEDLLRSRNNRINSSGLHDFLNCLKIRFSDANIFLIRGYIELLCKLIDASGKEFK